MVCQLEWRHFAPSRTTPRRTHLPYLQSLPSASVLPADPPPGFRACQPTLLLQLNASLVSGIKHSKLKRELWSHYDPILRDDLLAIPTPKVASAAAFGSHISHRLKHLPAAVAHYGARKYRQLRWTRYMKAHFAMASMCNSITGGKADTIVAYGNAKFACCGKGNEATPTTSLRKRLGTQCRVHDVDEFRTSKLCCACHTEMAGMPLPQSERCRRDGPFSYSVRLCNNRGCERMMWNRDVNAAINMLKLFLAWTSGAAKPAAFHRAVH